MFPGGGGNWGGSYLTVPEQSEHPEEAKAFAVWLTAPEQQIKAFEAKGTFPSQVDALDDPRSARHHQRLLQRRPDRRDPVEAGGGGHRSSAQGSEVRRHQHAFQQAIQRVDEGTNTPDEAWDAFLADVERAVLIAPRCP